MAISPYFSTSFTIVYYRKKRQDDANYSERFNKVIIARSGVTCLHAEVPAFAFAEAATRRQALRHAGVAIS